MEKKQIKDVIMTKKNNQEMVGLRVTRKEVKLIEALRAKKNRPNIVKRAGNSIKEGTRATSRFFGNGATHLTSYFKSFQDMSKRAESAIISVRNAQSKEEMLAAAEQLDIISAKIRNFAGQVQVRQVEETSTIVTEDTVAIPNPA